MRRGREGNIKLRKVVDGGFRRPGRRLLGLAALALMVVPVGAAAPAAVLPTGFTDEVVWTGLTNPTAIRFAPDGRAFVAEKSGLIKVFDGLTDPTPTVFADLRTKVHNFWDRGLLSLAIDPSFPTRPYVYVFYTYDAAIGGTAPRWGAAGATSDGCPTPPGATGDGCVVSGRLAKLEAAGGGNTSTGTEQVLVEDWCQQYPSHSVGTIAFGPDGALYASGGDGASFTFADHGQDGSPVNPCGDPPGGVGSALTPPTAEGGSLRSQDLRTSADPVGLGGAVIRVNPDTGAALSDNPLASNTDPNARRIIAYGLRNPFRFSVRPGTDEIWIGDVGWTEWEEINRITDANDSVVENFGWPCYEGNPRQSAYDAANLNICENLYSQPNATTNPYFAYHHNNKVVASESCPTGSSSLSGLAFAWYASGPYPAAYEGALFFADYSRNCIWAMKKNGSGVPAPGLIETFVAAAAAPVDLQVGPTGELFYADFTGGTIHRIRYNAAPPPPGQEDKARNKVASASSVDLAGHEAAKANDGNSTTRWSSAYRNNEWWQVDLGTVRSVDSVRLNWEVAYGSQYQVLTSTDGVSYAVAATDGATAAGWRSTSFAARQARFVRVLGVTRATQWGFSFWDAQVFGPADGSADTTAPSVSLTAPAAGSVSGTVQVAASASDNVGVVGVQFQLDGANLLTEDVSAPYSVDWNSATSANGAHTLTAIARDAAGNRTTSTGVVVNVANTVPGQEDKARNKVASASSVDLAGHEAAKANDGSVSTRWSSAYRNNEWWQVDLGSVRSVDSVRLNWEVAYGSQYQVLTSTDGVAFTVAATDGATGAGWRSTSFAARQARFVRVLGVTRGTQWGFSFWDAQVFGPADGSADTTAPSVSLTAPAAGSVSGTVQVAASASDNVGVVGVQFQLDGANLLTEDVSAPYSVDWNSATSANGAHTLTAIARDAAGNRTTSSAVGVTVSNSSPPANVPPVPAISTPTSSTTWAVGDSVSFSGSASDAEDGALSGSSLQWTLTLHHCPSNCHAHQIQTFSGSSGSFTAPDHDYPSHLELRLTATDSANASATASVLLQPRTTTLSFQTAPAGLQLAVGSSSAVAPFSRTVIVGSSNSVSAISPQTQNNRLWTFASWSDAGAQTHTITAAAAGGTFTATFADAGPSEDKALNKATSASSVDLVGHEAAKANDGSSSTRWSSAYRNNEWWQVDLGSVRSVDSVRLNWEVAYGSQYQVLTSTDGVAFTVAATDGATGAGWRSTSFAARQARFVRVLGVTRGTQWGFSFWDAQVFGPTDATFHMRTDSSGLPPPAERRRT